VTGLAGGIKPPGSSLDGFSSLAALLDYVDRHWQW
jgi:hypothetical protein